MLKEIQHKRLDIVLTILKEENYRPEDITGVSINGVTPSDVKTFDTFRNMRYGYDDTALHRVILQGPNNYPHNEAPEYYLWYWLDTRGDFKSLNISDDEFEENIIGGYIEIVYTPRNQDLPIRLQLRPEGVHPIRTSVYMGILEDKMAEILVEFNKLNQAR